VCSSDLTAKEEEEEKKNRLHAEIIKAKQKLSEY
jgi:hypothetical protein